MEKNKFEGLYIIGYGLSGGFGGEQYFEVIEAKDQSQAETIAYEQCCDHYESYAGSNGLRDTSQIMEDDGIDDEEEAEEIFREEREDWLEYSAKPYSKEYEDDVLGYHYTNNFKERTGDVQS